MFPDINVSFLSEEVSEQDDILDSESVYWYQIKKIQQRLIFHNLLVSAT